VVVDGDIDFQEGEKKSRFSPIQITHWDTTTFWENGGVKATNPDLKSKEELPDEEAKGRGSCDGGGGSTSHSCLPSSSAI
jgi:hypothetical protein